MFLPQLRNLETGKKQIDVSTETCLTQLQLLFLGRGMQKLVPSDDIFPTRRLEITNFHRSQFQNTLGSIHVLVPPGFLKPNAWVIKVSKRVCCAQTC